MRTAIWCQDEAALEITVVPRSHSEVHRRTQAAQGPSNICLEATCSARFRQLDAPRILPQGACVLTGWRRCPYSVAPQSAGGQNLDLICDPAAARQGAPARATRAHEPDHVVLEPVIHVAAESHFLEGRWVKNPLCLTLVGEDYRLTEGCRR